MFQQLSKNVDCLTRLPVPSIFHYKLIFKEKAYEKNMCFTKYNVRTSSV